MNGQTVNLGSVVPQLLDTLTVNIHASSATSYPQPGCPDHIPCQSGYCQNEGICQDLWTYKECTCSSGFLGDVCEIQTASEFSGNSFLHFLGQDEIMDLEFWITARSLSGMVLYTVSNIKGRNYT